jgi:2-phospho-L-lactate/phosphoenolpyruvate guanylyltransferase
MTVVVVPFREGKSRLSPARHVRRSLALAMLGDVLAATVTIGATVVVTDDGGAAALAAELGAAVLDDPGGGQGAAVAAGLANRATGPALVVNADLPCVVPQDLRGLLAATPKDGIALVEALDGTTNALSLPAASTFAPLYGPGSADRFVGHARGLGLEAVRVEIPNLAEDVDTLDDLERLQLRVGPRTQAALDELEREIAL